MFTSQLAFSLFQNNSKMKEHYLHSLWGLLFFAEVLFWLQQLASQNTLKYEKKNVILKAYIYLRSLKVTFWPN